MKINIKRFSKDIAHPTKVESFYIEANKHTTILNTLNTIKEEQDNSLTYRCGCKSGVCGSCAIVVDGIERLACKTLVKENQLLEPLKNMEVIKDLVVSLDFEEKLLNKSRSYLEKNSSLIITKEDELKIDVQSKCILCQSCYSSCPVYEVNKDFLGPYALTRVLRYVEDKKENEVSKKLEQIQKDGIWDCTLCSNCTMVCPQFIDPKTDIMKLRMKSIQEGYEDPTIQNYDSFGSGFDTSFDTGFDPNF